jgi:hypothetical protein
MRLHMAHRTPFVNRFCINELVAMQLRALSGCGTNVCASEQLEQQFVSAREVATC